MEEPSCPPLLGRRVTLTSSLVSPGRPRCPGDTCGKPVYSSGRCPRGKTWRRQRCAFPPQPGSQQGPHFCFSQIGCNCCRFHQDSTESTPKRTTAIKGSVSPEQGGSGPPRRSREDSGHGPQPTGKSAQGVGPGVASSEPGPVPSLPPGLASRSHPWFPPLWHRALARPCG